MIKFDPEKPYAYVFDIDGTLVWHKERGPFEYHKIPTDQPINGILRILHQLSAHNYIILLTGRPERTRKLTEDWFKTNNVPFNCLIMKEGNEYQKSAITKKDSMISIMEDYNIMAVFEDMTACVDMYKELGLTVCQIHNTYE